MTIAPGTRIGAYEITEPLGEGGMGVVYRARDTRLLRDVAMKVLPDHFGQDPDRLARFEREAQTLASLNHPNIAQIYGLEPAGGRGCIVMELVDGETLADRIQRGPVPYDEAIGIARQIADALAAAHERGIVHRDLKPANVKLTANGSVKVLDFGLAKGVTGSGNVNLSSMPTQAGASMVGSVVGTPAYMSPEQARGQTVDSRTDIWAFGCVLYEMLSGNQAFQGETVTDVIARIVTSKPDLAQLPKDTPPAMRLLLDATLQAKPQQRLQHIGDMRLFLDDRLSAAPAPAAAASGPAPSQGPNKLWVAATIAAVAAAAAFGALALRTPAQPAADQMRFEIAVPDLISALLVSPDGRQLAFYAHPPDEDTAIWVRPIDSDVARRLPGTDNANGFVWAPDSRRVAFFSEGKLRRVDIAGGSPQAIADLPRNSRGYSWSADGVILAEVDGAIVRVPDTGGPLVPVTTLDAAKKESVHAAPVFLPDGQRFVFAIGAGTPEHSGIFLGSLDGNTRVRLLPLPSTLNGIAYASGYILVAGNTLTAHRFDVAKGTVGGDPIAISETDFSGFSVSQTGLLFYRKSSVAPPSKQLLWYDRTGKTTGQVGASANYGGVELSPDGKRAVVDIITGNNRDVWVIDITRGVPSRLSFGAASDWAAVWSGDGRRIAYATTREGQTRIVQKAASGVGDETPIDAGDGRNVPATWTGITLLFSRAKNGTAPPYDTFAVDPIGGGKPQAMLESQFDKLGVRVSPDGTWVAYATNESGTYQIVVQSFPDPSQGKWQITSEGGLEPKWRADGKELYYLALDGKLMAVPVQGGASFEAGQAAALFPTPLVVNRGQPDRTRRYDVAPDGRFLIVTPAAASAPQPSTAVVNWTAGLRP